MRGTGRVRSSLSLAAAVPLTTVSTPADGARAQAVALARQLLSRLVLPSGARAIKLSSVPPPARPP